jgi:serine protease Do
MIASQSGSSSGVGFAIPSNEARLIANLLIEHGSAKRALMGLIPTALTLNQEQQLGVTTGAYVATVDDNTPAAAAGFKKGDVIVRIGSTPIVTYMDVRDSMYRYKAGDKVSVEIVRDGKHSDLTVTLAAAPPPQKPQLRQQQGSPFGDDPFGDGNPFQFNFPNQRNNNRGGGSQHASGGHLGAGIAPLSDEVRGQFSIPKSASGIVIESVEPGSLAESLGMQPGDVITKFNGNAVTTPEALVRDIHGAATSNSVSIQFDRWSQGGHTTIDRTFNFN